MSKKRLKTSTSKTKMRYEDIPQTLVEAVAYYLATCPSLTIHQICKKISYLLKPLTPTPELIEEVRQKEVELIKLYSRGGSEAVAKGIEVLDIPYATLHGRIKLLTEVITMCKDGYYEQKTNSRGEVVEFEVKDIKSVLEATKQLTSLMEVVERELDHDDIGVEVALDPYFNVENHS